MNTGVQLIAEERERQIASEGWTPEHDDMHADHELLAAGRCYTCTAHEQLAGMTDPTHRPGSPALEWPWEREWWKPSEDPLRNLVKAGALIAAEIDRLQRLSDTSAD